MKGVIILPKYLEQYWAPTTKEFENVLSAQAPLFYGIRDQFEFDLVYADEVVTQASTDVVIIFGVPYHNRPNLIPGLLDLNKNIKLIVYPGDLQNYNNPVCYENRLKVFERCDLILSGSYEYFAQLYPEFLFKYKFLPLSFSPTSRYTNLAINNNPKMQCLLLGSLNPKVYPLRSFIINSRSKFVNYQAPTYVGSGYAKILNSYFCCVSTGSIFNYAVAKYFEIPAAGSLLIGNEVNDLKDLGFVAEKHYISVTKTNVLNKIQHCLENPKEYERIRQAGTEFVRKNHSLDARLYQIKILIEKLMKG